MDPAHKAEMGFEWMDIGNLGAGPYLDLDLRHSYTLEKCALLANARLGQETALIVQRGKEPIPFHSATQGPKPRGERRTFRIDDGKRKHGETSWIGKHWEDFAEFRKIADGDRSPQD